MARRRKAGRPRGLFEERLRGMSRPWCRTRTTASTTCSTDDYYQFEGGMTAAVETLKGEKPAVYHNDHSRPERPVVRTLEEEIGRVVRARVVNPKWIAGVHAARLQGRLRDGGDRRLPVRLRGDHRARCATIISRRSTRPI
jgi:cobalamin biosynthesis Mg chelatase CobN